MRLTHPLPVRVFDFGSIPQTAPIAHIFMSAWHDFERLRRDFYAMSWGWGRVFGVARGFWTHDVSFLVAHPSVQSSSHVSNTRRQSLIASHKFLSSIQVDFVRLWFHTMYPTCLLSMHVPCFSSVHVRSLCPCVTFPLSFPIFCTPSGFLVVTWFCQKHVFP
jgi:hypothetical protein